MSVPAPFTLFVIDFVIHRYSMCVLCGGLYHLFMLCSFCVYVILPILGLMLLIAGCLYCISSFTLFTYLLPLYELLFLADTCKALYLYIYT